MSVRLRTKHETFFLDTKSVPGDVHWQLVRMALARTLWHDTSNTGFACVKWTHITLRIRSYWERRADAMMRKAKECGEEPQEAPKEPSKFKCHTCGAIFLPHEGKPNGCISHIAPLDCAYTSLNVALAAQTR